MSALSSRPGGCGDRVSASISLRSLAELGAVIERWLLRRLAEAAC